MTSGDLFTVFLFLVALLVLADFIVSLEESAAWKRFESSPYAVACPRCGAHRGQPCKGMRTEVHSIREKLARGEYR